MLVRQIVRSFRQLVNSQYTPLMVSGEQFAPRCDLKSRAMDHPLVVQKERADGRCTSASD